MHVQEKHSLAYLLDLIPTLPGVINYMTSGFVVSNYRSIVWDLWDTED